MKREDDEPVLVDQLVTLRGNGPDVSAKTVSAKGHRAGIFSLGANGHTASRWNQCILSSLTAVGQIVPYTSCA